MHICVSMNHWFDHRLRTHNRIEEMPATKREKKKQRHVLRTFNLLWISILLHRSPDQIVYWKSWGSEMLHSFFETSKLHCNQSLPLEWIEIIQKKKDPFNLIFVARKSAWRAPSPIQNHFHKQTKKNYDGIFSWNSVEMALIIECIARFSRSGPPLSPSFPFQALRGRKKNSNNNSSSRRTILM